MAPSPYATPLQHADLPAAVRAMLGPGPLQEPPQQGRTSRVAFALDTGGRPVVVKRSVGPHLELLRREARALGALHPLGVPAPTPLLYLEHAAPAGPGGWLVTPRWPGLTLEAALRTQEDPGRRAALLADFGTALARLHATPPPPGFGGPDWLAGALTTAARLNPAVDAAHLAQLRREQPGGRAMTLIHGDLFLDNVMVTQGRVTGFIDWGFAAVGDPRYDVAVAIHELGPADQAAFVEGYGPAAQLTPQETDFFVGVALLF
ncbi:phosphotransferase family protein [Deinococcus aquaedulcis]|uniref:phosphotransferase family protein n=1 Tax=Deinococcus aquaedulcis TaxID=2840455 RepID=UPI001C8309BF|nr:aminoglycoside phosphotransferase family protein [Deinococcus aquaedulcis]